MELFILIIIGGLASVVVAATGVLVDEGVDRIDPDSKVHRFFQWFFLFPLAEKIGYKLQESSYKLETFGATLIKRATAVIKFIWRLFLLILVGAVIYFIVRFFVAD